jgi:L-asparagine oxygenase
VVGEDPDYFIEARNLSKKIPCELAEAIDQLTDKNSCISTLEVSSFPQFSKLSATPHTVGYRPQKSESVEIALLSIISGFIGNPVGYRKQRNGSLVHDIVPTMKGKETVTSQSSKLALSFHTEAPFHPYPPEFISFYTLRNPFQTSTKVANVHDIISALAPDTVTALKDNPFFFASDFPNSSQKKMRSVLHYVDNLPQVFFDYENMIYPNSLSHLLLEFSRVAELVHYQPYMRPGSVCIVNNKNCVHGRSSFQALFDGNDRWLKRMYIASANTSYTPEIPNKTSFVVEDC